MNDYNRGMSAVSHITTAEQLWEAGDIGRCELVRGELVMMSPTGSPHARAVTKFARILDVFVTEHDFGEVYTGEPGFIVERNPDSVRAPDVAFVRADRVHLERDRGFFPGAPDDTPKKVAAKVQMWLDSGCQCVWVADPASRTLRVHRSGQPMRVYHDGETLTDEPLLPGFSLAVAEVFR